jgi:uncharacterized protein (TIGR02145 family)
MEMKSPFPLTENLVIVNKSPSIAPTSSIVLNPNFTYSSASDIGNIWKAIQIGIQIRMAKNLKTNKLNDNTPISKVTDPAAWGTLITPGYSWYYNASTLKATYGALYNWYVVNTGKLCPTGWHVPDKSEWETLVIYLGGVDQAGGKMKEEGTLHWTSPNFGATNESGFTRTTWWLA